MNGKSVIKQLKNGIIDSNPTLIQLLGMCPTLATTTSVKNAIGMGLAATAVLIFSNLFISLLRKFIPKEVRIAAYIVVISGFVTAVELLISAYIPSLNKSLGVFIPLIVVNCIILARAEAFASKNPPLPSMIDGLSMGLGFTCSLTVISSIREILGAGTWFGFSVLGSAYQPALMFIMPPGAFLVLGFLIALVHKLRSEADERSEKKKALAGAGEVPEQYELSQDGEIEEAPESADASSEREGGNEKC